MMNIIYIAPKKSISVTFVTLFKYSLLGAITLPGNPGSPGKKGDITTTS